MTILGDHFGPILFVLSPVYKLFPEAITLLIIQALFVSLSAIPIYLIALKKLKKRWLSALISLMYLSSIGILTATDFDFHLATISTLPISLILYTYLFKKWRLYWLCLIFALFFKEDIPLFILGIGLLALLEKQTKIGASTIIFSLVSFYLIKFQIMPSISQDAQQSYIASVNPIKNLINTTGIELKRNTINSLYSQYAYLSFLSPLNWFTTVPHLLIRFSSSLPHLWTNNWHYNANLEPFLATSTILAISKFKIPILPTIILFTFILVFLNYPRASEWIRNDQRYLEQIEQRMHIRKILHNLLKNEPISAQSPLVAHLANREKIYMFPEVYDAKYIVLDTSLGSYPMDPNQLTENIKNLEDSGNWEVYLKEKNLVILKKIM